MLSYFSAAYSFAVAHQAALETAAFAAVVVASILNKALPGHPRFSGFLRQAVSILSATPMAGARSAIFLFVSSKLGESLAGDLFDFLSKHLDVPLISKSVPAPSNLIELAPPPSRGFIRLPVLALLFVAALLLASSAHAEPKPEALADAIASDPAAVQPAEPPAPDSRFGGCVKQGKICFAPSLSITIAAINLRTKVVEGAFSPGIGYGVTFAPGSWKSIGIDAHFVLDPGAQQASVSVLANFFQGYFRFGYSRGFIGDTAPRLLVGTGISL